MKKMKKKKEKLLRGDLIECKILNGIDNAKACSCSQTGSGRGQAAANEFSSASLTGLIHTKPTGARDREARGRSFNTIA